MGRSKIIVVGCGVIGLTTAIRLQQQGHDVSILARDDPQRTTSRAAGAYWWPYKVEPLKKVKRWAQASLGIYRLLATIPASGVRFHQHYRFCAVPEEAHYCLAMLDEWEEIDGSRFGVDCLQAFRIVLPLIDVTNYLPFLEALFLSRGGKLETREVDSLESLLDEAKVVVNCTGVWAGALTEDPELFPIRGQTVRVRTPATLPGSVRFVDTGENQILILPRAEDCILGGTAIDGEWSLKPDEATSDRIVEACASIFPELARAERLGETVGLRPGRSEVRLELERHDGGAIVHHYGHGGAGFTIAWGCADDLCVMVDAFLLGCSSHQQEKKGI